MGNVPPHTLQVAFSPVEISRSDLSEHLLQYEWYEPPYDLNARPHSRQAVDFDAFGLPGGRPFFCCWDFFFDGGSPCLFLLLDLLAADHALLRAIAMARFSGSDMYLRMYSRLRRAAVLVRHASEQ